MIQDIAPHKFQLSYKTTLPAPEDTVFVFRGSTKREDRVLLQTRENGQLSLPTLQALQSQGYAHDPTQLQYLFSIDQKEYFLLNNGGRDDIALPGFSYVGIRTFCDGRAVGEAPFAGLTAYHLFFWYRDNTCCGRCGQKMVPDTKERAVRCPACGHLVYPRLIPAVIIAVRNGDSLLVSRYAGGGHTKNLALIAGFCEIGETLEQTVAREVEEEVGLAVKNITYFGSQPWGVECDLLVGFYADVDGSTEIHRDEQELAEAFWLPRDEIEPGANLSSLTRTMIEAFRTGKI